MNDLLEIEQIKLLKARYFRALDTKDWDLMAILLTEDCSTSYSDGKYAFEGRDATLAFLKEGLGSARKLSLHTGHHPEIELTDDSTATGIWYLQDIVLDLDSNFRIYGSGLYTDEYRKVDGGWQICSTGYKRIFECGEHMGAEHMVLDSMFSA